MSACMSFTIAGPDAQKFKEKIQKEALRSGMSASELIVESVAEYFRNQKS